MKLLQAMIVGFLFMSTHLLGAETEQVVAIQQAELQAQAKELGIQAKKIEDQKEVIKDLVNNLAKLQATVESHGKVFMKKTDAESTFAKPGRGVNISLDSCTEDYNYQDLGTVHKLSSWKCSAGKVSIGVRHYGAAGRVDRVYCCKLNGRIK